MAELKKGWREPHYTGWVPPKPKPKPKPLPPVGQGQCFAPGCERVIPRGSTFCRRHLLVLPDRVRRQLFSAMDAYENGKLSLKSLRREQLRIRNYLAKKVEALDA